MRIPRRRGEQSIDRSVDPHITHEGIRQLERERDRLEKVARPRVLAELQAAQALGDLSENAAYAIAKGRLRGIDRRMAEINERLKHAIPIEHSPSTGLVQIGSVVTVRIRNVLKTYHIVGSQEANPTQGKLSYQSPVGNALLGHGVGDICSVITSAGRTEYHIVEIR